MKLNPMIQKKIVAELARGKSYRQIARQIQVSPTTVTVIAKKLGGVSKSMLKKSRLNFDKIEKCK